MRHKFPNKHVAEWSQSGTVLELYGPTAYTGYLPLLAWATLERGAWGGPPVWHVHKFGNNNRWVFLTERADDSFNGPQNLAEWLYNTYTESEQQQ